MKNKRYSVLMSVYYKEKPIYLKESLESMLNQTIKPDEIVLVKDGPLTNELEQVINNYVHNSRLKVISIEKNVGLGRALNIGLENCSNEIIARMDTDDIAILDRCEKQLKILETNKEISVVGSGITEFIINPDNIIAYKEVKSTNGEIIKNMKFRNPINHPSVMFKKKDVMDVGGYKHFELNEDYFLWIRMSRKGYKFYNINEPLVKMRITNETYLRRGGIKYFKTQKKLFDYMLKNRMINIFEYLFNNCIRFILRVLIPNNIRKIIYLKILRKGKVNIVT
ncbi:glycosyltransferase [Exiguobacterium sp. s189]|uniref:glycosyltransferase n=1 Tax=Exiguobacterium sp. s189 TaxID=2751263 RepID=UPI001BEAFD08|nr:glycosyltransferase [Exiguobacterium sp. s189]